MNYNNSLEITGFENSTKCLALNRSETIVFFESRTKLR